MSDWANRSWDWDTTDGAAESAVPPSLFQDSESRKQARTAVWLGRSSDGCADAGFEASIRNLHRKPPFSWEASESCNLALKSAGWQPRYIPRSHFDYLEPSPPAGLSATLARRAIIPKESQVSYFVNSRKKDGSAATYEVWSPNASLASKPGPLPFYGGDGPALRRPQGAMAANMMFADASIGRLDPTRFPQCYDPAEPWLPLVVRSHDILQSQIPVTLLLPEHAAPGQFVERHRAGKDLVVMGDAYIRNMKNRYRALVKASEEVERSNDAMKGFRGRRPMILDSLFTGMSAGLVYSELWALVGSVRRQLSLLQAYVTFGRFLPTTGLPKAFNDALSTPRGRELFLTPMEVADSHFMGCWLADAPSSYAYFLATLRVPCFVFHRCLPGDLPAGASTFDGSRNYLKIAGVDAYVYSQQEVVNLPESSFLSLEELPTRFYGDRRVIRTDESEKTASSARGQEARLLSFEEDYLKLLEKVNYGAPKPQAPVRPRPAPRSAARPLNAALYRPSFVSLDPTRVNWCVPPPIAPMPEGKFAYYIETDPPRPTSFITVRNANQAEYQRIVEEKGAYTVFCRFSRRAFRLYSPLLYPSGCLMIDDFGFAVPDGSMRVSSVMGTEARLEKSPTWVYPYSPRAGTIGRKMKTPDVEALPLKIAGETKPFGPPDDEDDYEDYWEYKDFGAPANVGELQEEPQSGLLKAPTTEGNPEETLVNQESGELRLSQPSEAVESAAMEIPTEPEQAIQGQTDETGQLKAPEVALRPGSVLSWLKFWPGATGWAKGSIDLEEVVEGLHCFVQRKQGAFSTRAIALVEVNGFIQVYLKVDRPQEHAVIRGLLRHRPWPTISNVNLEVEDISRQEWDDGWQATQVSDKTEVTIVFKAPTFTSFCSLLRTHEQKTGQELDLADLPLSEAHLEMLGWPTKEEPLRWKEAPGAGYMPVEWIPSQLVEGGYFLKHYNGRSHARGLRGGPNARRARKYYDAGEVEEPRKVPKLHERMGVHITTPAPLEERLQQGAPPLEERLSRGRITLQERLHGTDEENGMDTN